MCFPLDKKNCGYFVVRIINRQDVAVSLKNSYKPINLKIKMCNANWKSFSCELRRPKDVFAEAILRFIHRLFADAAGFWASTEDRRLIWVWRVRWCPFNCGIHRRYSRIDRHTRKWLRWRLSTRKKKRS